MNPNNEPINQNNDNNIENQSNVNINPLLEENIISNNQVPEKKTTSLEDNIIEIPVPVSTTIEPIITTTVMPDFNEKIEVSPLPEVNIVDEQHTEQTNNSPMVEQEIDDGTINPKGVVPVFIVFGLFIISIIVLPYISDYINAKKEEERNNQPTEIITPTPTVTPNSTLAPTPTTTPTQTTEAGI